MRSDRLRLQDILLSIQEVVDCLPATQAEFNADKFVQSHVLRHIQIIGEAAWRVSQPLRDHHPHIPWKRIASMRHVLVHNYFEVNWKRVYETARDYVPPLKPDIEAIVASLPRQP